MKKVVYAVSIIAVLFLGMNACKPKNEAKTQESEAIDTAHNSRNSLDWNGTYTGTIPCADCEGITVQITLNGDETYQVSYLYLGKGDNTPEISSGKFTWDEAGNVITLDSSSLPPYYIVGENTLTQLDMEGEPIIGERADMYTLTKVSAE